MIFKFLRRIIFDVAILACLVQGWWYAALIVAVIAAWNHKMYVELIIAGLIYDSLYGPVSMNNMTTHIGLTICVVLFILIGIMKKVIRMRE
ncbi:MAG: hypothetical protein WCP09_02500 [Candidatus Taylorbacteria bacterium]